MAFCCSILKEWVRAKKNPCLTDRAKEDLQFEPSYDTFLSQNAAVAIFQRGFSQKCGKCGKCGNFLKMWTKFWKCGKCGKCGTTGHPVHIALIYQQQLPTITSNILTSSHCYRVILAVILEEWTCSSLTFMKSCNTNHRPTARNWQTFTHTACAQSHYRTRDAALWNRWSKWSWEERLSLVGYHFMGRSAVRVIWKYYTQDKRYQKITKTFEEFGNILIYWAFGNRENRGYWCKEVEVTRQMFDLEEWAYYRTTYYRTALCKCDTYYRTASCVTW